MKIDETQIGRVARLARLDLTEGETKEFSLQLSAIIGYVEKINELDTGSIAPADHIVEMKNVVRPDAVTPSMDRKDIEAMAPRFERDHFVVPRVIEG